jgi:FkbM family methyltransferase
MTDLAPTEFASVTNALGHRMYVDPHDERGKRMRESNGDVNPHSLELWNHALRLFDWQVAVDVGCNYGEMVVGAQFPADTRIIAFEPSDAVLPYLRKTLSEFDRPVELIASAVSDEVVHGAQFARDVTWSGKSSLILDDRQDTAADVIVFDTVEVTTLDAVLGQGDISSACIKVDVEGREAAVLRGAEKALGLIGHWALMLEILHMPPGELAALVLKHNVYLLDARYGDLVRVRSSNPEVIREMLDSGWLYPQDALLVSSPTLVRGAK